MSPNGVSSGFEEFFSSSESSEFDYFLHSEKNSGNISKQWEAIERTLYQEPGQQVTDPDLLKECKLWRETFPHFRVKGTKVNVELPNNESENPEKTVQTVKNHINIKKVEEKRADLKKKIVDMLVERMIAKYGNEKNEYSKKEIDKTQKTEIDIDLSVKSQKSKKSDRNSKTSVVISSDKESYFERGKLLNSKTNDVDVISKEQMEEKLYEIFDSWEKDGNISKPKKPTATKISDGFTQPQYKSKKFNSSLSNMIKPVEVANKIEKKYEGLIEKIMERKQNEWDNTNHCRKTVSISGIKSYQETIEKLRKDSGYDDYFKNKGMSKINRFDNNWLNREERNLGDFSYGKTQNSKSTKAVCNTENFNRDNSGDSIDQRFLKELKEKRSLYHKRLTHVNRVAEKIHLPRPKPLTSGIVKSSKSSSCKDLTRRNTVVKNHHQNGPVAGKSESDINKSIKTNNAIHKRRSQNMVLPPIESGIICTEITGHPKVQLKNSIKK